MNTELILWAKPKGSNDELDAQPIATQCRNQADIDKVIEAASRDGWHDFKVQTLNGTPPRFGRQSLA